jgi:H+-translocating NAD(P) transhydrogenase subunit alpha
MAPKIITESMVAGMRRGSVIVDLAAESGGNCAMTEPGGNRDCGGVLVAGPLNLASLGAMHASEMYARNLFNFLSLMLAEDGRLHIPFDDELVAKTCIAHDGAEPAQGAN